MNWISHFFGIDDPSGPFYLSWSGWVSDLTEIAIFGGLVQWYRSRQCHVDGCHHFGSHHVNGTPFVTCKKHHPNQGVTHKDILDAHRRANT